nr:AI-2E family transporter [Lysobacter pythonis]
MPPTPGGGPPSPANDEAPLAAPPRPRTSLALLTLATLALGWTLWATQTVILPILLALFFALIGNPIIRLLQKLCLPRPLSAVIVLFGGLALAVSLGRQLVEPVASWLQEMPRQMNTLAPKLRAMTKPVQAANRMAEDIARSAGGERINKPVQVIKTEVNDPYKTLTATPRIAAQVLAVILLTLFFMIFGQTLQKRAIELLPGRHHKRITIDILQSIEREMSRYVLTISAINAVLGLAVAAALHVALGLNPPEALLWGTLSALLNYAPYVGPAIGALLMLVMGLTQNDGLAQALLPVAIYLGLQTIEGQVVTPLILGRRMALSPLVLMLALMVFSFLWGMLGLLLAVPLLVCGKIILSKVEGFEGWARLLE